MPTFQSSPLDSGAIFVKCCVNRTNAPHSSAEDAMNGDVPQHFWWIHVIDIWWRT